MEGLHWCRPKDVHFSLCQFCSDIRHSGDQECPHIDCHGTDPTFGPHRLCCRHSCWLTRWVCNEGDAGHDAVTFFSLSLTYLSNPDQPSPRKPSSRIWVSSEMPEVPTLSAYESSSPALGRWWRCFHGCSRPYLLQPYWWSGCRLLSL